MNNDAQAFGGMVLMGALLLVVLIFLGAGAYVASNLGDALSHVVTVTR